MLNGLQIFILGFGAFVFSGFLTWPIRKLAIHIGAMDAPNLERKRQREPVPYLGGVSIALTVSFLTYVAVIASDSTSSTFPLANFVLIPALFMGVMGLVDDLKGAWASVVYNSSPSVASLIEGIPTFLTDPVPQHSQSFGIANTDLSKIENPDMPDRQPWVERLSMCHWNFEEMQSGAAWSFFRKYI